MKKIIIIGFLSINFVVHGSEKDLKKTVQRDSEDQEQLHNQLFYSEPYYYPLVEQALEKGADVNFHKISPGGLSIASSITGKTYRYDKVITPIMNAAQTFSSYTTQLFIQAGADVNAQSEHGATALMFAANNNSNNVFRLCPFPQFDVTITLLQAGADPFMQDIERHDAFWHATRCNKSERAEYLHNQFKARANRIACIAAYALQELAHIPDGPISETLHSYIAAPIGEKAILNTMKSAIRNDDVKALAELAKNKAHLKLKDENGYTPLLDAIESNKPVLVKLLLDAGADKNDKQINGLNAIQFAQHLHDVRNVDNKEVIKLLLGSEISLEPRGIDVE